MKKCLAIPGRYIFGYRVIEYTNRGKQVLKNFRISVKGTLTIRLILGLGKGPETGAQYQNGADFLVARIY
jgi:hypothetical protein